jgi:chemosensory pili system protein ChpA (sensor histidine kinase/response regulator)
MKPKQIKKLQEQITQNAHFFYEALANLVNDGFIIEEIAPNIIENIHHYVTEIGKLATQIHLKGLAGFCHQTSQNLTKLEPIQIQSLGIEIERWPKLVSNYLYFPSNLAYHHQMISFLQHDLWPQPCEEQIANELRENFFADLTVILAIETNKTTNSQTKTRNPKKPNSSIKETSKNKNAQKSPPALDELTSVPTKEENEELLPTLKLSKKMTEIHDTLSSNLAQFMTFETDHEAFFEGLNQYTDALQILWELAESLNLKGFQDVCTFINDNIFECSSLSRAKRKKLQKQFTSWPQYAIDYLKTPDVNAKNLVDYLALPSWPVPMSSENTEHLLTQLLQDSTVPIVKDNKPAGTSPLAKTAKTVNKSKEPPSESSKSTDISENAPDLRKTLSYQASPDSTLFSDKKDEENADNWSDFEPFYQDFYQELNAESSENETLNLTKKQLGNTSRVDDAWIEKSLGDEWELEEEEKNSPLSTLDPNLDTKITESTLMMDEIDDTYAGNPNQNSVTATEPLEKQGLEEEPLLPVAKSDDLSIDMEIPTLESDDFELAAENSLVDENPANAEVETEEHVEIEGPPTQELELTSEISEKLALEENENKLDELSVESLVSLDDTEELSVESLEEVDELSVESLENPEELASLSLEEADDLSVESLASREDAEELSVESLASLEDTQASSTEKAQEALSSNQPFSVTKMENGITESDSLLENGENLLPEQSEKLSAFDEEVLLESDLLIDDETAEELPIKINDLATDAEWLNRDELCDLERSATEEVEEGANSTEKFPDISTDNGEELTEELELSSTLDGEFPELSTDNENELTEESATEEFSNSTTDVEFPELSTDNENGLTEELSSSTTDTEFSDLPTDNGEILTEELSSSTTDLEFPELSTDNENSLLESTDNENGLTEESATWNENEELVDESAVLDETDLTENVVTEQLKSPNNQEKLMASSAPLSDELEDLPTANKTLFPQDNNATPNEQLTAEIEETLETTSLTETRQPSEVPETEEPSEIILCDPDILAILIGQINEIAENNLNILPDFLEAEDGNEGLLMATMSYTENVQALWDAAEMANLLGVQEICTFVNDNVMALGSQPQSERQKAQEILTIWPECVIAYLQNPRQNIDALLTVLQQRAWPNPLNDEIALILQQPLNQSSDAAKEEPEPQPTSADKADAESDQPTAEPVSTDLVLAPPEILAILIDQITEVTENNQAILPDFTTAEDGSETLLMAAMTYTENMQAVWDAAEMANLAGVQEICTFINDNVMALGSQPEAERQGAQQLLATWPETVIAYLQNPLPNREALLALLQQKAWPNPVNDETILALQAHLFPNLPETEGVAETRPTSESPNVGEPKIVLATPEIIDVLIGQINEIAENNQSLIPEIIAGEAGCDELLMALMSYTDNVQALWDVADMAKLAGLQEVCTFLNENIMALGSLSQAEKEAARSGLWSWPELVIAYLQNPATHAKALADFMQGEYWPSPLDDDATETLFVSLTTAHHDNTETSSTPIPETIVLATPDILELVCNQIIDSKDGLSAALEVCLSMENDNPAFLEAIEDYTNKVQEILEVAEMAGLSGLIEVCSFVNNNFVNFGTQEKEHRINAQKHFIEWPAKILEYLHSPATEALNLVNFLQETAWPVPLTEEEAKNLFSLLTQPAQTAEDTETVAEPSADEPVSESLEIATQALTPLDITIPAEIWLGRAEDLEVLIGGIDFGKEDLTEALNQLMTIAPQDAAFADAQESYTEPLQHWTAAAEMVGLEALEVICNFVITNVNGLNKAAPEQIKKARPVLASWPDLVLAYLQAPTDNALNLVNCLRVAQWTQPLTDEAAQSLLNQLVTGAKEVAVDPRDEQERETEAHPDDVVLTPSDDIDPELWEAYLQEAPQNAEEFSECIQKIIHEPDIEDIKRAQRIAHTLKGSSRIVGIKGIANVAHHLEDTLEYLAEHQVVPPEALTHTMVDAADCLAVMVDALMGVDEPPANALEVLQAIIDWANQIDKGKLDAPIVPKKPQKSVPEAAAGAERKADKPKKAPADQAASTPEQMLNVPTQTIDELMRLVGELSISLGQIQEKLKHVVHNTRLLTEQDLVLQQKTFELENLVDVRGITGVENRQKKRSKQQQSENGEEDFDPLEFQEYNELHSVAHGFTESIADNRELALSIREELTELETMFIQQERLNKDFQTGVMTTRMKQVKTIIAQLERNVRQTANKEKKKAKLEVTGAEILVDSNVLNNLIAPLRHILNNALAHGIEEASERTLLGKPEVGTITLSFYHEGNNVVVKCVDDGQGLNYTNIRFKAIEKGLITENQELSEPELARLILMAGFSTKAVVNQVSGRGIGMDVVHTSIRQMKGTLDLMSETGKGSSFIIKLPMTLVTVHVLVVRIGERRFGIPTNNLEQALAPGVGEFHSVGEEMTLKLGKNMYAIKSLANLLTLKGDWTGFENLEKRPILLVHEETGITAVLIDEFLETHDLVMKNMGKYVKKIHGVGGASILGDGSLVPLLDVPELLRSPMQAAMTAYMAEHEDETVAAPATPHIMIVDDSLSVRKSLSLLVENAGFEPVLAKDGLEAIEVMNETRPNVMLVDMEMPRMDGLELTAHVRANQATQTLPIFMITSRTTEKHRQQAKTAGVNAYLTKPYQDTELLDLIDKALGGQI